MDAQVSFNLNRSFCDKHLISSSGMLKQYSTLATDATISDTEGFGGKVPHLPFYPIHSSDSEVASDISRRPICDIRRSYLINGLQRCIEPYPVFRHPTFEYVGSMISSRSKKQRSEKRAVPEEQKDAQYYEKRKRNNKAAKKSRDARKLREDQIAFRAAILENENALLRTQVLALREEASLLRHLLMEEKTLKIERNTVALH